MGGYVMTKSYKRIEWEERIKDWKASGLSKAKWCRENGVKEHQMYYWLQRIDDDRVTKSKSEILHGNFLPVNVFDESKGSILIHIDRMSVEVQPDADIELLARVLKVLQSS